MKNKYLFKSHISQAKFREILKYFSQDFDATKTSSLTSISRVTINRIFDKIRTRIINLVDQEEKLFGEIEVDESYFGAKRVRGKRGRGAKGKIPVVGLLKRNGKVFTQIIENCKRKELMPVIKGKILEESTIYTDGWKSYASLEQYGKHNIIRHDKDEFAREKNHINGIEGFWSFAKERFHKYHGIKKNNYSFYLKEIEFRFNHRNRNVFNLLFDICIRRLV